MAARLRILKGLSTYILVGTMVLQKEGLTYCFFFPPLTIVKIETRQIEDRKLCLQSLSNY